MQNPLPAIPSSRHEGVRQRATTRSARSSGVKFVDADSATGAARGPRSRTYDDQRDETLSDVIAGGIRRRRGAGGRSASRLLHDGFIRIDARRPVRRRTAT